MVNSNQYQRRGRPTISFDEEKAKKFISAIRLGMTRAMACKCSGITAASYRTWRVKASDGEQPYLEFMEATAEAEGEGVMLHLQNITDRAQTDWRASAWWLERVHAKDYGDPQKVIKDVNYLMKEINRRRNTIPENLADAAMFLVKQEPFLQLAARVQDQIADEKTNKVVLNQLAAPASSSSEAPKSSDLQEGSASMLSSDQETPLVEYSSTVLQSPEQRSLETFSIDEDALESSPEDDECSQ